VSEPRLMTAEELAAVRGRAIGAEEIRDTFSVASLQAMFHEDDWPEDRAECLAHAPYDVPALLAHIDALEGLLRDCAADEGRGVLLRHRRALEAVAALARREMLSPNRGGLAAAMLVIADKALAGGE
jgi:hypothetical protein